MTFATFDQWFEQHLRELAAGDSLELITGKYMSTVLEAYHNKDITSTEFYCAARTFMPIIESFVVENVAFSTSIGWDDCRRTQRDKLRDLGGRGFVVFRSYRECGFSDADTAVLFRMVLQG